MAEALVSAVLEQLVSFTSEQLQHEWSLISGIKGKVKKLTRKLEAIQAVLVDAEKRQIKDASVRNWLWSLKEVSFQIDVVLDEWNTTILRADILKKEHPFSKVCFSVQSSCFHDPLQVNSVGLRRRIARKIEDLNQKLDGISSDKDRFSFITTENNRFTATEHQRPKTTSFDINIAEVFGREAEKKNLITKLLSESSEIAERGHEIIPLVGAGGIGKTTLALLAYNDETVSAHFDPKIWVCVSDPFDEKTIARAIAESLEIKDFDKIVEFQKLLERIHESIEGKKFLLVLDDVWAEEDRKWKQLENSLRNGAVGSKILVTTRKERVAIMMGAKNSMIRIEHLSGDVCWSIFSQIAFLENEKSDELVEIGRQIAQRSKGLPLVAKTLGSLMRFKKYTKEEWERVLHSELWQLQEIENEVFVPLLLSYYDLPPLEKRCFLYTSFFPKDHVIDRDHLIQLWSSEGYLNIKKDYKRKGIECFENLAMRSLFQDFENDKEGDMVRCKMHDIVHDFLLFLSENDWLNKLLKLEEENISLVEEKAFHCMLVIESGANIPPTIYRKKFLRTLSVRGLGNESDVISWDMLLKLTCLRTLDLHDCNFAKLPKGIKEWVHLRYLSLSQSGDDDIELPESMCNLFNLQTLILECSVRELPKGIHKLVNLRHLYLKDAIRLPKGLRELTCLETLNKFCVATEDSGKFKKRHMKLEDLNKLNHLKGSLCIVGIGRVKDVGEADRAQLKRKEGLVELKLYFGGDSSELRSRNSTLLLEGLQPHPNLKHLVIGNYYGTTLFPGWMTSLINLKSLVLNYCPNCESLGPFGKLPSLESLTIWGGVEKMKKVGVEFLGIGADSDPTKMDNCSSSTSFPKLKHLEFLSMRNWEEWESCTSSGNEDRISLTTIMPSLFSLVIDDCVKLKAPLPGFLRRTPLQNLTIRGCPNLGQLFKRGMGTEELEKILTSPSSQHATDTKGETHTSAVPQVLRSYDHEISPTEDDDENLQEHRALHL